MPPRPDGEVSSQPVGIVIVDLPKIVSELLTKAFASVPDIQVLDRADGAAPSPQQQSIRRVDVILMRSPLDADVCDGLKIKRVRETYDGARLIAFSEKPTFAETVALFGNGASGVFSGSEVDFDLLCKSIRCVHRGEVWANNELVQHLVIAAASRQSREVRDFRGKRLLSKREQQVLDLLADGLSNCELAAELNLSEHTIKNHLFRIYDKLGVSNRMEAVLYALTPRSSIMEVPTPRVELSKVS